MLVYEMNVEYVNSVGTDLDVVNAARVSFAKESHPEYFQGNLVYGEDGFPLPPSTASHWHLEDCDEGMPRAWRTSDKDAKLISYLAKHNHITPFMHCFATFRVRAPIFVARQLVKHQVGGSWNEESRRYIDDEPGFYLPIEWRARPQGSIKQGSGDVIVRSSEVAEDVYRYTKSALSLYRGMLADGVAPEQARMVLPLNTMTNWIWSGSLAFWARVCKLRLDPHSQAETTEVAKMIDEECRHLWPVSWEALLGS